MSAGTLGLVLVPGVSASLGGSGQGFHFLPPRKRNRARRVVASTSVARSDTPFAS
jgi:hypothetical protein